MWLEHACGNALAIEGGSGWRLIGLKGDDCFLEGVLGRNKGLIK